MADTNLPSTPADGNILTLLVPAIADLAAPTVAELTAGTVVDISCYLTPGGFNIAAEQATITDERECDVITRGAPGRKTPTLDVTGIDNTNNPDVTDNALAESLTEGSVWYGVRRRGKPHTDAPVAGDVVTIVAFTTGGRAEVAAEANSVIRSIWSTFVQEYTTEAVVAA